MQNKTLFKTIIILAQILMVILAVQIGMVLTAWRSKPAPESCPLGKLSKQMNYCGSLEYNCELLGGRSDYDHMPDGIHHKWTCYMYFETVQPIK